MNAIEIRNLSKNFGPKQAVCGLDMTVPMGAIYGFIGENGSGKSTTEKMICGLTTLNLVMCMVAKILLMFVFVPIFVLISVAAK